MADKHETIDDLEKSGAYSKAAAQQRHREVNRDELAKRTSTTPTNLGGGDGTKK